LLGFPRRLEERKTRKFANTANPANPANGALGIPPKTRYHFHLVNAKLTPPFRFAPGQQRVPGRFNARASGFCSYFQLFPLNRPRRQ